MKLALSIFLLLALNTSLFAQTEVSLDSKVADNKVNEVIIEMNPNWQKCVDDVDCTLVQSSCQKWLPVATESVAEYTSYLNKTTEDCSLVLKDFAEPRVTCIDQICRADGTEDAPTQKMLSN